MRALLGLGLAFCGLFAPFAFAWVAGHWRGARQGVLMAVGWVLLILLLAVLFGVDGLSWLLGVLGIVCVCLGLGAALIMFSLGMPIRDISGVLRGHRRVS